MDAVEPQVVPFGADSFVLALLEPVYGWAARVCCEGEERGLKCAL